MSGLESLCFVYLEMDLSYKFTITFRTIIAQFYKIASDNCVASGVVFQNVPFGVILKGKYFAVILIVQSEHSCLIGETFCARVIEIS